VWELHGAALFLKEYLEEQGDHLFEVAPAHVELLGSLDLKWQYEHYRHQANVKKMTF